MNLNTAHFHANGEGDIYYNSYPFAKRIGNLNKWDIWVDRATSLTLSELEEVWEILLGIADILHLDSISMSGRLWRFVNQTVLDDLLLQWIETLSMSPFDYDFYPQDLRADEKEFYRKFACKSVSERLLPEIRQELYFLFYTKDWTHHTDLEKASAADPNIFSLVFKYGPEACYSSGLVKTRMTGLVGNNPQGQAGYVPVVRYSSGPTATLFFGELSEDACGTFYYYEKDSNVGLAYDTIYTSRSKYSMALEFLEIQDLPPIFEGMIARAFREIRKDLTKEAEIQHEAMGEEGDVEDYIRGFEEILSGNQPSNAIGLDVNMKDSTGQYENALMAMEDPLDQPLCMIGKYTNTEILMFTHMAGSSRLVTEVLDTRSRQNSLDNLFYLK